MAGLQQFVGSWQETEKEGFEEMATALGKSKLWIWNWFSPINLSHLRNKKYCYVQTYTLLFAQTNQVSKFKTRY